MKTPFRREILHTKSPKGRDGNGNIHQVRKGCLENCSSDSIHHAIRNCWVNPFTTTEHKPEDKRKRMPQGGFSARLLERLMWTLEICSSHWGGTERSSHANVQLPAVIQTWIATWFSFLVTLGLKYECMLQPQPRLFNGLLTCYPPVARNK